MLYSKQEWSLKLYEEKGEKKLVYLPMMEWMYTVITAGYRKKNVSFMWGHSYECFCTLLVITVA